MRYTQIEIEEAFNRMNDGRIRGKSGCKDTLQFLVDMYNQGGRIWWWSWEFVGKTTSTGGYLSHKAPARASDLALIHGLFEDRRIGRFKVYRLRQEKAQEIKDFLSK